MAGKDFCGMSVYQSLPYSDENIRQAGVVCWQGFDLERGAFFFVFFVLVPPPALSVSPFVIAYALCCVVQLLYGTQHLVDRGTSRFFRTGTTFARERVASYAFRSTRSWGTRTTGELQT